MSQAFWSLSIKLPQDILLPYQGGGKAKITKCVHVCGDGWEGGEEMADEKRKTKAGIPVVSGVN